VASGSDVNGDGYDDIMVASPVRYVRDAPQRGADTLLSGRTGEVLADLELWDRTIPETGGGGFWSVTLGDFDGDGLAEFAIGSGNDEVGGENSGRVWIFRGFRADAIPRCAPPAHSGGLQARVVTDGSLALSVQDMWLRVLDAPPQSHAVLFTTPGVQTTAFPPFGLCIGGPGTLRISGALPADANGTAEIQLDLGGPPLALRWLPGTHWTVQAVFRDAGGPTGLGVTNALVIQWGP